MKVNMENTGPCRKILTVELPAEMVAGEYDKVVEQFAARAAVPGYRKGKAPRPLIERRYNKPIMEEVKDSLVFRSYRDALKKAGINPVAVLDLNVVTLEPARPMIYKVFLMCRRNSNFQSTENSR